MTRIIPSRPKRPAEETLSSPFRTPKAPTQFSSAYTPEEEYVSSMFNIEPKATLTRRPEDLPIMQPVYKQSAYDNTDHEGPSHRPQGSLMWPSEMYGRYSTAWLVSPSTDQSSDNSPLLRTEIQAHRITREMLQATEQRRLEAVQSCQRLHIDLRNWSVAYSNIYHILGKRDEEISRQRADNEALKERLRDLGMLPNEGFNTGLFCRDEGNRAHRGPHTPDHGSPYQELRFPMPPPESGCSDRPYSPEV